MKFKNKTVFAISRIVLVVVSFFQFFFLEAQEFNDDVAFLRAVEKAADSLVVRTKTISMEKAQQVLNSHSVRIDLNLPKPSRKMLTSRELFERAKSSTVIVATAYLCPRCSNTHISTSSGYVVDAKGIVVTNYHVVASYAFMTDGNKPVGFMVRASNGRMYAVKSILTASKRDDLAILELETGGGDTFTALPLAEKAQVGDQVYVMGHPKGMHYFFSQGYVNHKYIDEAGAPNDSFKRNVMAISADYATGSSGGPVMDQYGNIVGTVSNTRTLMHSDMNPSVQMVIKNTIPVESLRQLIVNPEK
ncbi:S1 family peptidase [Sphingobacterium tabacisoli]|uniref:Serine protease n=1 Tax=Sphingobacterium tabacisoli TaxID=2044855 RepID=A0ABW5L6F3_9SPHI|nr:serine protease [Sphingobacterium tabacisoli]